MEEISINFDVLIPAHGESIKQVETLLQAIHLQRTPGWKIGKVFLCSDKFELLQEFGDRSHIDFVFQHGQGKPNALNLMLDKSTSFYCVQNSADCIPAGEFTYYCLLRHFFQSNVGAVTSRPSPTNKGFMWLPSIAWVCHEFTQPKLNAELFAFRKDLVPELPNDVIHDDGFIHNLIAVNHFRVIYEPEAVVLNRAPETFTEFYTQRKKNVVGNIQLARQFHMASPRALRLRSLILMSLELLANVHGRLDYVRGKIPKGLVGYNLESTKEVI